MAGKPTPDEIRATARKVDAFFAHLEARKRNLARAVTIVRNLKAIPKKYDTMPDLVKRR
jgi:hypothetical protein